MHFHKRSQKITWRPSRAKWEFTMFWNRAIESYCVLSASKLGPVCVECCAVERWPFEELGLLKNNYRRTLAAPSVLFHTYMTAVQTAQLHIPHPLSYTPLSVYSNALIYTYIQCPPLILAPLVNMSKGSCENKSALFILFIFHSKNSQISNLSLK